MRRELGRQRQQERKSRRIILKTNKTVRKVGKRRRSSEDRWTGEQR